MSIASSIAMNESADASVYRKVAWRIIPFLLVCYLFSVIDRFNIGFAKLQFIHDLHVDDAVFGTAAGLFYVGYIALEVPSNLWFARVGVRLTLLRIMIIWGGVTCFFMFANGATSLYVLRFLLGVAEAGFFPGILFYITLWFPDRLRGRMTSLFVVALPAGGIISGPLSGLIMEQMQNVGGLHGWQWLFVLEGVPTMICGVFAYFYLNNSPNDASWLSRSEMAAIEADLEGDRQDRTASSQHFLEVLKDPRIYLFGAIYFAYFSSLNAVLVWTPTILKALPGQTITSVGWITGGLAVLSTLGMVIIGYSSDRMMERRWHVALCGLVASVCFLSLPWADGNLGFTVCLLGVASVALFSIMGLFWTIPSAYLNHSSAAGGIALISSLGSSGGAFSPMIIGAVKVRTDSLYLGLDAVAILTAIGMIVLLIAVPRRTPR
jgi:sugar phosphate permease